MTQLLYKWGTKLVENFGERSAQSHLQLNICNRDWYLTPEEEHSSNPLIILGKDVLEVEDYKYVGLHPRTILHVRRDMR